MILDSNILIYSIIPEHQTLRDLIAANAPSVSAISLLEVLGFHKISEADRTRFETLFASLPILDIDRPVLNRAVSLRQQRNMSLGDAIIAASALVYDKTLVTRNTADFKWIPNLRLLNPLDPLPD